jgi:ABC-type uncharacterized transport system substrate-binding protein
LPKRYQPVSFANLDSFTSVRFRRRLAAKFELMVNLKAIKPLGIALPQTLLIRADRVLE